MASINRCPRTMAEDGIHGSVNFDAGSGGAATNDRFCMEGQRLVLISGTYGADGSQYRTEVESFAKIIAHGSAGNGPAWFEVHTKAGQVLQFGNTTDSRVLTVNATTFAVGPTARAWLVNQAMDTRGNYYNVTYTNDTANGQVYPIEVDYTGNAGSSPALAPYNSIKFSYGSRADVIPTYQAGMVQQLTVLLSHIKTYAGSTLVSDYQLLYKPAASGAYHDELKSVTQCDGGSPQKCLPVVQIGWQGGTGLPSMTTNNDNINYGGTAPSFFAGDFNGDGLTDVLAIGCPHGQSIQFGTGGGDFVAGDMVYAGSSICDPDTQFTVADVGDINGDGFSDVVQDYTTLSSVLQYWYLNTKTGTLETLSTSSSQPHPVPLVITDFNGDGQLDFFSFTPTGDATPSGSTGTGQIFTGNGAGYFTAGASFTFGSSNTIWPSAISIGDFDGDGCSDLLTQGSGASIFYSCNPAVSSLTIPDWYDTSTTGEGGYFQAITGDFNGDGKSDVLVVVSNGVNEDLSRKPCGEAYLYLSTGTGLIQQSFSVPNTWCYYQIVAGDFNGDGKTDIALVPQNSVGRYGNTAPITIWLSTGTGFVQALSIPNLETADCTTTAFLPQACDTGYVADWNNDGAADLWISAQEWNGSYPSIDPMFLFNYVPELVTSINNGVGSTTTISYDRLNKNGASEPGTTTPFYTKGTTAIYPTQDVDGAIYVVAQVTRTNGIGGTQTTSYSYTGAQKDLSGRGFLGFAQVAEATPTETTPFCSGATNQLLVNTTSYSLTFPNTGQILSQTKAAQSSACSVTLSKTENTLDTDTLPVGLDGVQRYFVAVHSSVLTTKDLNAAAFPTITTTHTYDCDSNPTNTCYGNETVRAVSRSDGSSITTTDTYADDAANWLLGRVATSSVNSIVGSSNKTRQSSYCYDVAGSSCPDPNSTAPSGLLMQQIVEPESSSDPSLKLETDYGYDVFGNKTTVTEKGCVWLSSTNCSTTTGTATRTTTTVYDTTTYHGQFATKITNALGQYETFAYDTAFGGPTGQTDLNGLITTWSYDTFGRQTQEVEPDGDKTIAAYTYCTGLPTGESCPTFAQFDVVVTPENSSSAQNGAATLTYYDGLARIIAKDAEGFDASGTGPWIRVASQYDAYGQMAQTSRPYFLSGGSAKWTVYTNDAIGRVSLETFPDASQTTYGYNGLTTTVTNDKSQVTTTVKNAQGLTASVEDAASNTTSYVYDAFGNLLTVTDPSNNVTTNAYDLRGRKTSADDPDMGNWSYVYDGFGELYSQTDAKGQLTTLTYDALGRTLSRAEVSLTSTWVYDTASGKGVGQLASATTGSTYTRTLAYDSLARPSTVTLTVDGTANPYMLTYDANGRVATVGYPSGFTAQDTYTTLGYLYQVSDNGGTHQVFWTADTRDAELHLLTQTAGNSLVTTDAFDPDTGRPVSILAGASNSVSNQTFTFDTLGNLTSRTWLNDAGASDKENACYDNLNRLTSTLITTGAACTGSGAVTVAYDALGNITSKSDICSGANCMSYGGGSSGGPHALTSITGTYNGVTNPNFGYDANGNMMSGGGRSIASTSFNMALSITDGGNSDALTYDTEHARVKQVATGADAGTTYYLNDPASGLMSEKFVASGGTTWRDYIMADGKMLALRSSGVGASPLWGAATWGSFQWTAASSGAVSVVYFTLDHLGSISVVTDSTGAVLERDSYDPWGLRRNPDGTAAACGTIGSTTTRGFTGQEMMDSICYVNFNARVYDPSLGRFMSADSVVPDIFNGQSFNRYSYVDNGPLSLTDPSGHYGGGDMPVPGVAWQRLTPAQWDVLNACASCNLADYDANMGANSSQPGTTTAVGQSSTNVLQDSPSAATVVPQGAGAAAGPTGPADPRSSAGSLSTDPTTELAQELADANKTGATAKNAAGTEPDSGNGDTGSNSAISSGIEEVVVFGDRKTEDRTPPEPGLGNGGEGVIFGILTLPFGAEGFAEEAGEQGSKDLLEAGAERLNPKSTEAAGKSIKDVLDHDPLKGTKKETVEIRQDMAADNARLKGPGKVNPEDAVPRTRMQKVVDFTYHLLDAIGHFFGGNH